MYQKRVRKYNKYRARPVKDPLLGYFRSTGEYRRYLDLLLLQKSGEISGLEHEKRFLLIPAEVIGCKRRQALYWKPDFYYTENGREVVEDYKSEYTLKGNLLRMYRLGRALFKIHYPDIEVREYVK